MADIKNTLLFEKAKKYVEKYHGHITRKSGEPYTTHLWNVYTLLKRYDLPEELLISALLHDCIEDSEVTEHHIEKEFGERIAFIVSAVSKMQKPQQPEKYVNPLEKNRVINAEFYEKLSKLEYQNFRFLTYINKFYYSVVADPWVAFVKIADQIDNLRDVEIFPLKKAKRKLDEIYFYFWPIYERITEKGVMSEEITESYEKIKTELWEMLQKKKTELQVEF